MATVILSRPEPHPADEAVRDFITATVRCELAELLRIGLIPLAVYARCARYLERHPEEFAPEATGPISSTEAVDWLLTVAS